MFKKENKLFVLLIYENLVNREKHFIFFTRENKFEMILIEEKVEKQYLPIFVRLCLHEFKNICYTEKIISFLSNK